MPQLSEFLSTTVPQMLRIPSDVALIRSPVVWSGRLVQAQPELTTIQIMRREYAHVPNDSEEAGELDPKDPDSVRLFLNGVQTGLGVHARLQVLYATANKVQDRSETTWLQDVYNAHFAAKLAKDNPLGSYCTGSIWLSAGRHVYEAHMDIVDGLLFQLYGSKRVKVWIPLEREPIFRFDDVPRCMTSEPYAFNLSAGHVLFIPAGAVHEVVAGETSVSVSFHLGAPYPLLALCSDLNSMLKRDEFCVPDGMDGAQKDTINYFAPARYVTSGHSVGDIPPALVRDLLPVLQTTTVTEEETRNLLSSWWNSAASAKSYRGPLPDDSKGDPDNPTGRETTGFDEAGGRNILG
jgi:hypothetical protein